MADGAALTIVDAGARDARSVGCVKMCLGVLLEME